jgi:hypothetical protein
MPRSRAPSRARLASLPPPRTLTQADPAIRAITAYQVFWETHTHPEEDPHAHVEPRT